MHGALLKFMLHLEKKRKLFECLEIVYKLRGDFMPWIKADFYFKPLLNEPGFKDIAGRLKLPA